MSDQSVFETYRHKMREIANINNAIAVLHWDQEIYLPSKGGPFRSGQIATLSGISHDMSVSKELGQLLSDLMKTENLEEEQKKNVAESYRDYQKRKKYSREFVEKMSRTTSEAFHAWAKARKENNFSLFEPHLQKIVALKRREADFLGYEDHPYEALMDAYEPGAKVDEIDTLFADVRRELVSFVREIQSKPQPENRFLHKFYPKDKQWEFGLTLLREMGYDFESGRQDLSPHPFTTTFAPSDVRVTTRVDEYNLRDMVWSCIHEGGHALYEQGLRQEDYGLPSAESISLGIHESQSRLWENNVGRSKAYWHYYYPKLQAIFPENLADVSLDEFYEAINIVKASLIRTEADELTYHFHIMIRYEIEKGLIEGRLDVKDLPEIWHEMYKEYLDVDVPNHADGVLQDIHWSHGSFGYFPTYSLGSFYAAQFFHQAGKDIPELIQQIQTGKLLPLLDWLRNNIHQYGRLYSATDLCRKVCGEKLQFSYFMEYARKKYADIYGL